MRSISQARAVRWWGLWSACWLAVMLFGGSLAWAQGSPPAADAKAEPAEQQPETLPAPWESGPKAVSLGHEVTVDLPAGYAYLPPEPARKVLERNGSFHNDDVLGLLASTDPQQEWFVVTSFEESGFIKDDEKLDGDELLSSMRDGLDEMNEERKKHGFKPLALDGWGEPPRYDQGRHHLVWALIVSDPEGKSVNLNTRVLGRRGYVSLNLVTDPKNLAQYRHHGTALLTATHFANGARYEDFNEKTDKMAEYGLAGLIMAGAGLGAAKLVKLGLLAKFSKVIIGVLIAGKKVIVVAVLALAGIAKRLFSGRRAETPPSPGA
ncbi:MAG TPA: DUF2167 domain-containing protein [Polyangiaceae bacterium]|nr:DUF2167 domain-containing protein [Polyangiaceae bacterium]